MKYLLNHITNYFHLLNPETDLPGFEVQKTLSPPYRGNFDIEIVKKENPRTAAVLILLYENELGEVEFPIMLRNRYDGVHSNQYSLPGGSYEAEDQTYENTAIRETAEELGVWQDDVEIIGQLTELYIPPSQFLVYPFVGIHQGVPTFNPDEEEVQFVVPIDLEAFLHANPTEMNHSFQEQEVNVPAYRIGDDEFIWGATAMILEEFKVLLKNM